MIPALCNHLWQSTLGAAAAGGLAFGLRKNRAEVRYWLWWVASLKFLVPFGLLVDLGVRLRWTAAAHDIAARVVTPALSFAAERATQPFLVMPSLAPAAQAEGWVAWGLLGIWGCGCLTVGAMRLQAWRRIRAAVRTSTPMGLRAPEVEVRVTSDRWEPGVWGIVRPILLLPKGILERLTPPQLEAVLAHEACHVRRRDNFFAALHMIVEGVFWFYPPVWWIGARMVEERERACDEAVLEMGGEPGVYAGAIVSVCRYYAESPLGCVAGVTGADVRRRIEYILGSRRGRTLSGAKKLLLGGAAAAALAGPALVGAVIGLGHAPVAWALARSQAATPAPRFTVASVKPSGPQERPAPVRRDPGYWAAQKMRLPALVNLAYYLGPDNIVGMPAWARTASYDIQARMPPTTSEAQLRLMLQGLLADRFQLRAHRELRPMEVSVLAAGPRGPDLHPASHNCVPAPQARNVSQRADGSFGFVKLSSSGMELAGCSVSMAAVAGFFSAMAIHPVIDETGLPGLYDIDVTVTNPVPVAGESREDRNRDEQLALQAAFHKQLGLELNFSRTVKRPMPVLVIEHLAPATAN